MIEGKERLVWICIVVKINGLIQWKGLAWLELPKCTKGWNMQVSSSAHPDVGNKRKKEE